MLRLLARPRYALLALVVVLAAVGCVRLGIWQLDRYEARAARADVVRAAESQPPTPLATARADAGGVPPADARVVASGRYEADATVLLRNRPQDGRQGWHVLVPLRLPDGTALLVDRGFLEREPGGPTTPPDDVPAPPPGSVEVTGWVEADEDGELGFAADERTVRRVGLGELGAVLGIELLPVWLSTEEERPAAAQELDPLSPPSTSLGPHLSYAFQWWLLGAVGIVGFVVLLRREAREEGRDRDGAAALSAPPS